MNAFKTKGGSELPILNLKGKDYLEVKYRIVWFREEHPNWTIETSFSNVSDKRACARAEIKDETGRIIATSHKVEDAQGFPDFMEKAETGAIGRALALIGYGTQFCADELDEGQRIVDAPTQRKAPLKVVDPVVKQAQSAFPGSIVKESASLGDYVPAFGKYKGQALSNFEVKELQAYVAWIKDAAKKDNKPIKGTVEEFIRAVEGYAMESDNINF